MKNAKTNEDIGEFERPHLLFNKKPENMEYRWF